MTRSGQEHNDKLDLFKCLAIYSVILAHIPLPGELGQGVCAVAKFSVALFFLASGYFSWGKDSASLARRAGHTGALLLKLCGALLALGCVLALRQGQGVADYLAGRMDPFFFKEILLYQVIPLPYAWPLWFLASLFLVYLIWWAITWVAQRLGRPVPYGALALVALGLLGINLSLAEGRALLGGQAVNSMVVRNAWLDGLPFFALGAYAAHRRQRIQGIQGTKWMWLGVAGSVLLAMVEFSHVGVVDVFVGTSLLAVLLLCIALVSPQVSSPLLIKTACYCGQRLTFYIFALHVPIYGILKEWQNTVPLFARALAYPWLTPFLIGALATALAWGMDRLAVWKGGTRAKGAKEE